mgnify:CR=1 FL=1
MFSTNKNRKIGMLIFLFVVSFIVGMKILIMKIRATTNMICMCRKILIRQSQNA